MADTGGEHAAVGDAQGPAGAPGDGAASQAQQRAAVEGGGADEAELEAIAVQQRLNTLLSLPSNQFCAECQTPDPEWASVTLGVFICLRCSGIHRSLGVHKSFVRSVTLDTWKSDQVEAMEKRGNAEVNARLLSCFPADPSVALPAPESSDDELREFIQAKYVEGRYTTDAERQKIESDAPPPQAQSPVMREFLTAVVTDTKRVCEKPGDKGYTVYVVQVQTNLEAFASHSFSIERRYSEFEDLHRLLKSLSIPRLPPMPEKTFFGRFDDVTIQKRIDAFNAVLDWCGKSSFVRSHREFLLFLQPR